MYASEYQIQCAVVEYLEHTKTFFWHTPNGELRAKATAGKLKKMGVRAGVPDLLIAEARLPWAGGLFVELKSHKGRLSPRQRNILAKLCKNGYAVAVCNSVDDAISAIDNYLAMDEELCWKNWQTNWLPSFLNAKPDAID